MSATITDAILDIGAFDGGASQNTTIIAGLAGATVGLFFTRHLRQLHYPIVGFAIGMSLPIQMPLALIVIVCRACGWFPNSLKI
jgi:hypothetical protein